VNDEYLTKHRLAMTLIELYVGVLVVENAADICDGTGVREYVDVRLRTATRTGSECREIVVHVHAVHGDQQEVGT